MSSAVRKADFVSTVVNPSIGNGISGLNPSTLGKIYATSGWSNAGTVDEPRKLIDVITKTITGHFDPSRLWKNYDS